MVSRTSLSGRQTGVIAIRDSPYSQATGTAGIQTEYSCMVQVGIRSTQRSGGDASAHPRSKCASAAPRPRTTSLAGAINGGPKHGDERIPNWPPSVDDFELIQLQGSDEPEEQQESPTESKRLALLDAPEIIRLDDETDPGVETPS